MLHNFAPLLQACWALGDSILGHVERSWGYLGLHLRPSGAILGACWPILAPIWASPEPMLSLGWAISCQVEPMLVDLVLKRRSSEAALGLKGIPRRPSWGIFNATTRVPKRAFNSNKTSFLRHHILKGSIWTATCVFLDSLFVDRSQEHSVSMSRCFRVGLKSVSDEFKRNWN